MTNKNAVLVDSSVWIHYFRRGGGRRAKEALKEALTGGRVTTCWVVKAELLMGTRNEAGFRKLDDLLSALPDVPIDGSVWHKAARIGAKLRRRGVTMPLPDLLIAQAAMQAEIELWHTDSHFEEIGKITPLHTKNFAPSDSA
ncbi:MAG TPA: PIN domain nuclease [Candidatus Acetothermia bacterium]|nr:PIN domain nuclease [Candidatus Acetothermia bacterium]